MGHPTVLRAMKLGTLGTLASVCTGHSKSVWAPCSHPHPRTARPLTLAWGLPLQRVSSPSAGPGVFCGWTLVFSAAWPAGSHSSS